MPVLVFRVEQLPENAFFRVVGTRRITGGGADAAILFADQIFSGKIFGPAETPILARALVQIFGERFRQTVGQRLGHDGIIIVMVLFEMLRQFIRAVPGRHGKSAEVIRQSRLAFGAMKSASA